MSTEVGRAARSVEGAWRPLPGGPNAWPAIMGGLNLLRAQADLIVAVINKMVSPGDRELVTMLTALIMVAELLADMKRVFRAPEGELDVERATERDRPAAEQDARPGDRPLTTPRRITYA